jgi:hypothetical protein
MKSTKKLSLKVAGIFAAAISSISGNQESSTMENDFNNISSDNTIEYTFSQLKVKPVGVFKLNPNNLDQSRFVASHGSHSSHSSHASHASHRSRTSFV